MDALAYSIDQSNFVFSALTMGNASELEVMDALKLFRPPVQSLRQKRIEMRPIEIFYPTKVRDIGQEVGVHLIHPLEFDIEASDIIRITNDIRRILRDPKKCLMYLQDLNLELESKIREGGGGVCY